MEYQREGRGEEGRYNNRRLNNEEAIRVERRGNLRE
jgi:hypothetical protein